jgi:hypothetical protein
MPSGRRNRLSESQRAARGPPPEEPAAEDDIAEEIKALDTEVQ